MLKTFLQVNARTAPVTEGPARRPPTFPLFPSPPFFKQHNNLILNYLRSNFSLFPARMSFSQSLD
jgi:hypothetical protein